MAFEQFGCKFFYNVDMYNDIMSPDYLITSVFQIGLKHVLFNKIAPFRVGITKVYSCNYCRSFMNLATLYGPYYFTLYTAILTYT